MASFDIAYKLTKGFEGGYADVPGDRGGITYAGITQKNFPKWKGWTTVLSKPRRHNEHIPELDFLVKEFYRTNFWDRIEGDSIKDQEYANNLYDMAVNAGVSAAIKLAQETLYRPVTGILSDSDLNHINGLV